MARIRTIKPEFPQSESMGKVSREARLCFVMMWTLADDAGRLRGNSRMLASLLFPYDDDAPGLIDGWLTELEDESCILRYQADGASYVEILNWLNHQKIDRPSESKIPSPDEASRGLARPPRRIKDQGRDQGEEKRSVAAARQPTPPSDEEKRKRETGRTLPKDWTLPKAWGEWALQERPDWTAEHVRKIAEGFRDHWHANANQRTAKKADWLAAWRSWVRKEPPARAANGTVGSPVSWWESRAATEKRGIELGRPIQDGEPWPHYRRAVFLLAGPGPWVDWEIKEAYRISPEEGQRTDLYFRDVLTRKAA